MALPKDLKNNDDFREELSLNEDGYNIQCMHALRTKGM